MRTTQHPRSAPPSSQHGFTLIELMIVVVIIGVLVTLAMPSYQNYLRQSKFAEVVAAAAPLKLGVELCIQDRNNAVLCNTDTAAVINGIPPFQATRYAATGTVVGGTITMTAVQGDGLAGLTYVLTPVLPINVDQTVQWNVGGTCVAARLCRAPVVAVAPPANQQPAQPAAAGG